MNITEFLEARIVEDEEQIREWDRSSPFSTERLLAECSAKRAVIECAADYSPELEHGDNGQWAFEVTLRALAAVYKDHPDYNTDWAL